MVCEGHSEPSLTFAVYLCISVPTCSFSNCWYVIHGIIFLKGLYNTYYKTITSLASTIKLYFLAKAEGQYSRDKSTKLSRNHYSGVVEHGGRSQVMKSEMCSHENIAV